MRLTQLIACMHCNIESTASIQSGTGLKSGSTTILKASPIPHKTRLEWNGDLMGLEWEWDRMEWNGVRTIFPSDGGDTWILHTANSCTHNHRERIL